MIRNQQIAPKWDIIWTAALASLRQCAISGSGLRENVGSYLKVLSGTFGRLVLQTAYFLVLVNTLSLADMGTFAAVSATGLMIGCFSGLGFASVAFRAAAGRWRLLGAYTALFYALSALTMPLGLIIAAPVYGLVFAGTISFPAFAGIIVSEITCFRMIDGLHAICNGAGRFMQGATILIVFAACRALAALALLACGSHSVETWAYLYFFTNAACLVLMLTLFRPRVRLRWHPGLFVGRLKEALLFAFVNFTGDAQKEIDKIVLVVMLDERAAGLYAIATRVIELATVPIKTFYIIYSRRLIREQSRRDAVRRNMRVEAGVAFASLGFYAAFLVTTSWFPMILGPNVAAARPLYAAMLLVPVFKNMMDLHSELYFAYRRMGSRAVTLIVLILLKVATLALVLTLDPNPVDWGLWLNAIFAGLWLLSACAVYSVIGQGTHNG